MMCPKKYQTIGAVSQEYHIRTLVLCPESIRTLVLWHVCSAVALEYQDTGTEDTGTEDTGTAACLLRRHVCLDTGAVA